MTMFRSRTLYAAFAVGAIVGCLAASVLGPRPATADPQSIGGWGDEPPPGWSVSAAGLPIQNRKDIASIKAMLEGLSTSQEGDIVFDKPVRFNKPTDFRDPTKMVELFVDCAADADTAHPAMKVCGPVVFESHEGAVAPSRVILNDRGPQYPEPDFLGPALQVDGRSKFTGDPGTDPLLVIDPDMHMGPALAIKGNAVLSPAADLPDTTGQLLVKDSFRATKIRPDTIELLVFPDPDDPEVVLKAGSFVTNPDDTSSLSANYVDTDELSAFKATILDLITPTGGEVILP